MDLKYCEGCRNDFYNKNKDYAKNGCIFLKSAKLVLTRQIHIDKRPPHDDVPLKRRPSCYVRPKFVYLKKGEK